MAPATRGALAGYNEALPTPDKSDADAPKRHCHAAWAAETTGLILIALLLLIVTLIRYWRVIHWSVR